MWILINQENMIVTHRHPSLQCINNVDYIESWNISTVTMEDSHAPSFERFTDYELKMLYENLCGKKFEGYNQPALIQAVAAEIQKVPVSNIDVNEAMLQSSKIPLKREAHYRYNRGAANPIEQEDLFKPEPLVSVPGYLPTLKNNYIPTNRIETKHNVDIKPNAMVTAMMEKQDNGVKVPRAPRQPSEGASDVPKAGGKTRAVWDIADAVLGENAGSDKKSLRKLVAQRCEEAGINSSTMSVQFSKWSASKNL